MAPFCVLLPIPVGRWLANDAGAAHLLTLRWGHRRQAGIPERLLHQSVTIRECWRVSFMNTYTSSEQAMQAVTYQ